MDQGTNAKKTILGQEVSLKLGYVGVKNRSQQDILDKVNVKLALQVFRVLIEERESLLPKSPCL